MARRKPINNLVIVSDLHAGHKVGLCCDKPIQLDEGGTYHISSLQRKMIAWWDEFWGEYVPDVVDGEPYDVLCNGDALDGVHHGSTEQISHNLADQQTMAFDLLWPVAEKCRQHGGKYYHIRGTEAHVGKSAQDEEMLARLLGAKKNKEGHSSRYDLWKFVGRGLVHCLHHIGTTGSQAYEATAVHKELVESFAEAARWGDRPPDIIVRSHRHRSIETSIPSNRSYGVERAQAIVTPGWQGKTGFVWKIAGGRLSTPQFGGIVIRQQKAGVLYVRTFIRHIKRSTTEI